VHQMNHAEITMVTCLKNVQIPYGVCDIGNEGEITGLREKPYSSFNVNTGIYVLEPSVIADIPANEFFNMTDLIAKLLKERRKVGAYPVIESRWRDMGQIPEMYNMIEAFKTDHGE